LATFTIISLSFNFKWQTDFTEQEDEDENEEENKKVSRFKINLVNACFVLWITCELLNVVNYFGSNTLLSPFQWTIIQTSISIIYYTYYLITRDKSQLKSKWD